jgi:hypothetical protein
VTISTSSTRDLTIGELVRRAFNLAGLLNENQTPSSAQRQMARDFLDVIIDDLAAEGVLARELSFYEVSLTPGATTYALADTINDTVGVAMYIPPGQFSAELPVLNINSDEWQRINDRQSSGAPVFYFADRSAHPIVVKLWPIPADAGTVRFRVQKKLADNNDDNATVDLEQHWKGYLLWELAHVLATSSSLTNNREHLARVADQKKKQAKLASGPGGSIYTYVRT